MESGGNARIRVCLPPASPMWVTLEKDPVVPFAVDLNTDQAQNVRD